MTWISHLDSREATDAPPVVVRRPRDVDAIGGALAAAFDKRPALPAEWAASLQTLETLR